MIGKFMELPYGRPDLGKASDLAPGQYFVLTQPFEIVEDRGDELLLSKIHTRGARNENLEQVARLAGGLRPGRGRRSQKLLFEVPLTRLQVLLVRLDLG